MTGTSERIEELNAILNAQAYSLARYTQEIGLPESLAPDVRTLLFEIREDEREAAQALAGAIASLGTLASEGFYPLEYTNLNFIDSQSLIERLVLVLATEIEWLGAAKSAFAEEVEGLEDARGAIDFFSHLQRSVDFMIHP